MTQTLNLKLPIDFPQCGQTRSEGGAGPLYPVKRRGGGGGETSGFGPVGQGCGALPPISFFSVLKFLGDVPSNDASTFPRYSRASDRADLQPGHSQAPERM
jgi:hypothetical protein